MSSLSNITRIEVNRKLLQHTIEHLRKVGEQRFEGITLWAGMPKNNNFYVTDSIAPTQKLLRIKGHTCVTVENEELHRLNVWLYQNKKLLIAQIHSHPGEAYHSDTDDQFPIVTAIGSISVVVPNFARNSNNLNNCALYRLDNFGRWNELSIMEKKELINITG